MMDGMKGLLRIEYDRYCHQYVGLVCISQDEDKLKQRAALDNPESKVFILCDDSVEEMDDLSERNIDYYIIKDIETI